MLSTTLSEQDDAQLNKFERMVREKIGERTHGCESDTHALQRQFRFFDRDGTGALTIDEFGTALQRLGVPIDRRLVSALFDRYDPDHDGTLSYVEFSSALFDKTDVPLGTSIV